jgi:hypothetical protein
MQTKKLNFFFLLFNIAIPIISILVGIFVPHNRFENAVMSLLSLIFIDILIIKRNQEILQETTLTLTDKVSIDIQSELGAAFKSLENEVVTLRNIADEKSLDMLQKMTYLHNQLATNTKIATSYDLIVKYLVEYHMKSYVNALHDAHYNHALPLPSEPRMEVAMAAIGISKQVLAVSIDNDLWHYAKNNTEKHEAELSTKSRYTLANIDAAKKGSIVHRIFIVHKKSDLARIKSDMFFQYDAGVQVRWGVYTVIEDKLAKGIPVSTSLTNILVCDKDVLTHSFARANHDGRISLNQDEIERYISFFWNIWEVSEDYFPDMKL